MQDPAKDVPKNILSPTPGLCLTSTAFPPTPSASTEPVPQGPQAQRIPREARPVFNHPLQDAWPKLHIEVYEFLDFVEVTWSTIDPIRFAEEGKEAGPVHLWIGVVPNSRLSFGDAQAVAIGCKKILTNAGFPDIEIAFMESLYIKSSGPRLLEHDLSEDPIADIRYPFTPSLGIQIAPKDTPNFEGTGAIYLRESSQSKRVFLLTARHVALPPPKHLNQPYSHKFSSQSRIDIVILGDEAYTEALNKMEDKIKDQHILIGTYQGELKKFGRPLRARRPGELERERTTRQS